MRIEYQLRFRDYLAFSTVHQFLSIPVQLFFGGIAALLFFLQMREDSLFAGAMSALFAYLAMWAVQLVFNIVYLCFGSYHSLLTKHIVDVQDDAFVDETKFSRSYHFWTGINRVVSRTGFVAVYINASAAHIIPGSAFASTAQREEFVSTVRSRIHSA